MKNKLVVVFGPSGSGKSTLVKQLADKFHAKVSIIEQDSYYFGSSHGNNYDCPNAIDFELLYSHVLRLLDGDAVEVPVYDFSEHKRTYELSSIVPQRIIILDGTMVMADRRIRSVSSLNVYCDAPLDVCLLRRIIRDVDERGRSLDGMYDQYIDHVKPGYKAYIEPYITHSDVRYSGNRADNIINKIESII